MFETEIANINVGLLFAQNTLVHGNRPNLNSMKKTFKDLKGMTISDEYSAGLIKKFKKVVRISATVYSQSLKKNFDEKTVADFVYEASELKKLFNLEHRFH